MKRLTIGIVAHVDSGKTTLSEALLYRAGALRRLGRVDHRDAFLDTHAMERARGITIFSKQAVLQLPDTELTLLDTPGHADLCAETERTLSVLDCAVLVVSGASGVQTHTETLWRLLARYRVPVFIFVNKMDLPGADRAALMTMLRSRLDAGCVDMTGDWCEEAALCDETLMERFLQAGTLTYEETARAVSHRAVFPCYFGSALRLDGVDALLDGLRTLTAEPVRHADFGARVFKIGEDAQGARLTYIKVTGGALPVKTLLHGTDAHGEPWQEKADQLRLYSGASFRAIDTAPAGTVCAVTGLAHSYAGEGLGCETDAPPPVLEPSMVYRVTLPEGAQINTVLAQLRRMEQEDPLLHVVWDEALGELRLQLMGEIQLEVTQALLQERCGVNVTFDEGGVLYKESIAAPVVGVGHYEPLRHYAEVHLLLEPGARGSGLRFAADCREDTLDGNWQRLILTHLAEKTHVGALIGAPITDMKITLLAGHAHAKHTEGGDFRQATYRAVRQGLRSAQGVLLEPWYDFRLRVPEKAIGRALADMQRMAGRFEAPRVENGFAVLTGSAPVAELRGYAAVVASYTSGAGAFSCVPRGYEPCHNAQQIIEQSGYQCDADTANTADSIFCSHGAGQLVKWNEAPAHMHVSNSYGRSAAGQAPPDTVMTRRAAAYSGTLAQDKELMEIFERTYGKTSDAARKRFLRPQTAKPAAAPVPIPQGPTYVLVDGYNFIFSWDRLRTLAQENMEGARRALMDTLCSYQGFYGGEVIVVFDAYRVKGNTGSQEQYHNIAAVYTREAETADAYIERVTHTLTKNHRVRVVTSDGPMQMIILGNGALRVPSAAFAEELESMEKAIRALIET